MRKRWSLGVTSIVMIALMQTLWSNLPAVEFPPKKDEWIQVETPNFTVFSNASRRRTLSIAVTLEGFRNTLAQFYEKMGQVSPIPSFVYVFKHDASFTPYKVRYEGKPIELAGYFVGHPDGNYIALNGNPQTDPLDVIYHEYIHHFLEMYFPRMPIWLGEGLADCYSTFRAVGKIAEIGRPVHHHLQTLRSHTLMPLVDLLALDHLSEDYHRGERRGIFYAESWALVHYLLWGNPERRPQLAMFLEALRSGEDPDDAFRMSFDIPQEQLENELRYYIDQQRFHFTIAKFARKQEKADPEVRPMAREEVLHRLGDLLFRVDGNRIPEAEAFFLEALEVNPSHAQAHASLGCIRGRQERFDEAITHFERAVEFAPDDFLVNYHFAETLTRRHLTSGTGQGPIGDVQNQDLERAKGLYRESIKERPSFAEAYASYGRAVWGTTGNLATATQLLNGAWHLLPARADLVADLAILYAAQGERAKSRHLIDKVLPAMGDPTALQIARSGVERIERFPETAAEPGTNPALQERTPAEIPSSTNPDVLRALEDIKRLGQRADAYNRHVRIYNEAVEVANGGALADAIKMLEELLPQIVNAELAAQTSSLLEQMKSDLQRLERHQP